jgi:hypothetical protein
MDTPQRPVVSTMFSTTLPGNSMSSELPRKPTKQPRVTSMESNQRDHADRARGPIAREGTPMRPRLRLFTGEDEGSGVADSLVSVRFGEITRALADAVRWNRTWLRDFEDDEISVSSDLYEVISQFSHLRPSA